MDEIDKKISYYLLKNARTPLRTIAREVGISAQALNYRYARMLESGVIRKFSLHVNQGVYGMISGFAAFNNDNYISEHVISRFRCLEEITIYEFSAKDLTSLQSYIDEAMMRMGEPVMRYIPPQRPISMRIGDLDRNIISRLVADPRIPISDISKDLKVKNSQVKRRIDLMEKNRIIYATAEFDLSKSDFTLFSLITPNVDKIFPLLGDNTLVLISDKGNGIIVSYSNNMKNARSIIQKVRGIDPATQVMVVYDYEFKNNKN